jgi:hypothetical protein
MTCSSARTPTSKSSSRRPSSSSRPSASTSNSSRRSAITTSWTRGAGPRNLFVDFVLPQVPEHVRRVRELLRAERPDIVVYHPIAVGAPWACELEGGVPTVSITPSPTLWATPGDPVALLPGRAVTPGPLAAWFGRFVSQWYLRFLLDAPLNRLRRELGLPPERDQLWGHARTAALNLGVWSPLFRAPINGDPVNSHIVGFTWHDRDHNARGLRSRARRVLRRGGAAARVRARLDGRARVRAVLRARGCGEPSARCTCVARRRPRSAAAEESAGRWTYQGGGVRAVLECVPPGAGRRAPWRRRHDGAGHRGGAGPMPRDADGARPVRQRRARVPFGCGRRGLPFAQVTAQRLAAVLAPLATRAAVCRRGRGARAAYRRRRRRGARGGAHCHRDREPHHTALRDSSTIRLLTTLERLLHDADSIAASGFGVRGRATEQRRGTHAEQPTSRKRRSRSTSAPATRATSAFASSPRTASRARRRCRSRSA